MTLKNQAIALLFTALSTCSAYAAQLTVKVAPGVHFSQLQKIYGANTPVYASLAVSTQEQSISSGFGNVLSQVNGAAIDAIIPLTNLEKLNPDLHGSPLFHLIPFSFDITNATTDQVYYQCKIIRPVAAFLQGKHSQLLITGLNNNDCIYIPYA